MNTPRMPTSMAMFGVLVPVAMFGVSVSSIQQALNNISFIICPSLLFHSSSHSKIIVQRPIRPIGNFPSATTTQACIKCASNRPERL